MRGSPSQSPYLLRYVLHLLLSSLTLVCLQCLKLTWEGVRMDKITLPQAVHEHNILHEVFSLLLLIILALNQTATNIASV